ncbi:MAG: hypothetical protein AB7I19_02915 [Planctomycetota bacterium]
MGWLRFFLLGDFGQQLDIHDQKDHLRAMSRSQSRARVAVTRKVADLTQRVDALERIVGQLGRLLVARGVLTEAQLDAVVDEVAESPDSGSKSNSPSSS